MIVRITDLADHSEAGQYLRENQKRATVGVAHGYRTLPRTEQGKEGRADRRHASSKTGGALGCFKGCHCLLEQPGRGIRIAAIDITGGLMQRYRLPGLRILKGKRYV